MKKYAEDLTAMERISRGLKSMFKVGIVLTVFVGIWVLFHSDPERKDKFVSQVREWFEAQENDTSGFETQKGMEKPEAERQLNYELKQEKIEAAKEKLRETFEGVKAKGLELKEGIKE